MDVYILLKNKYGGYMVIKEKVVNNAVVLNLRGSLLYEPDTGKL